VATGATEGWDVTDSSLSPLESKLPVENAEEEQGTSRHSAKSADALPPALCTLHELG